ncbi:hypothetical protein [Clostridium sp.]
MKWINKEKDLTYENENVNLESYLIREGYSKVEEKEEIDTELEALRAKAKELGIKSSHLMKAESLIAKIAELE